MSLFWRWEIWSLVRLSKSSKVTCQLSSWDLRPKFPCLQVSLGPWSIWISRGPGTLTAGRHGPRAPDPGVSPTHSLQRAGRQVTLRGCGPGAGAVGWGQWGRCGGSLHPGRRGGLLPTLFQVFIPLERLERRNEYVYARQRRHMFLWKLTTKKNSKWSQMFMRMLKKGKRNWAGGGWWRRTEG